MVMLTPKGLVSLVPFAFFHVREMKQQRRDFLETFQAFGVSIRLLRSTRPQPHHTLRVPSEKPQLVKPLLHS